MRTNILEVWDDGTIKDAYTVSDGNRLPAPILTPDPLPALRAPNEAGLEALLRDIEECE